MIVAPDGHTTVALPFSFRDSLLPLCSLQRLKAMEEREEMYIVRDRVTEAREVRLSSRLLCGGRGTAYLLSGTQRQGGIAEEGAGAG